MQTKHISLIAQTAFASGDNAATFSHFLPPPTLSFRKMASEAKVQVRLMSANSLRAVNVGKGASDPYAVVTLRRTGETKTTVVCLNTVDPKWYHNLDFKARPDDVLDIRIFDKNLVAGDRDLGTVSVIISDALRETEAVLSEAAFLGKHQSQPQQMYNYASQSYSGSFHNSSLPYPPLRPHQHPPPPPPEPPHAHHFSQHTQQQQQPQQHGNNEPYFPFFPNLQIPNPLRPNNDQDFTTDQSLMENVYIPSAPPLTPPPESEPEFQPTQPYISQPPLPSQQTPSLYPHVPTPPPHVPSATNPVPPPPPPLFASQPAPPPSISHSTFRSSSDSHRSGAPTPSYGLTRADVTLQRSMTRSYPVSPRGWISLVVAPGTMEDLARSAPRNRYKRFQTHKFSEQVGNIGKLPFQNRVGHSVGNMLKKGAEMSGPLKQALDLFQPVQAAFQEHSTWKVDMRDVDTVFHGKRHGWNRNYPAAQKIFQGKSSHVSRLVVQMQHSYLYGGASGIKPLVMMRKDLLEVTGNLLDASDFIELMEDGIRRGKPRMFTYVLMAERLYMAETGAKFFRDMMSKHAMHCSASPEVVYAGELHFRKLPTVSGERKLTLVVDNNSGTYTPDKADLPLVADVFRRNFAGLQVVALDYKDPLLEQYRSDVSSGESGAVAYNNGMR